MTLIAAPTKSTVVHVIALMACVAPRTEHVG
jgi:hypothetical protein